jgi:hypothetical protein
MTDHGRRDAARLLLSLSPPERFLRHACAVADVAAFLAARAAAHGRPVDAAATAAAGLLHDVDKLPRAEAPAHLRHGEGSAAWLAAHGWPELGPLVRDHPVTRLVELDFEAWLASAPLEARIVSYADKRARQRLIPMAKRFAIWRQRYPPGSTTVVPRTGGIAWDTDTVARIEAHARELERSVCAAAGVAPHEVRRLRWSVRTLREVAR